MRRSFGNVLTRLCCVSVVNSMHASKLCVFDRWSGFFHATEISASHVTVVWMFAVAGCRGLRALCQPSCKSLWDLGFGSRCPGIDFSVSRAVAKALEYP